MPILPTLDAYLDQAHAAGSLSFETANALHALAQASKKIAQLIAQNGLAARQLGEVTGAQNTDGDSQKALDILADEIIFSHLKAVQKAPQNTPQSNGAIKAYLSEEREAPLWLNPDADLICACDPLDGSSNIDMNLTVGTIFSLIKSDTQKSDAADLLPHGRDQQAAGFFAYGPQTALIMTIGAGVVAFCLDEQGTYQQMAWQISIVREASEFAINMSNRRHWSPEVARYIDDLQAGATGPRGRDFNMRWAGSLVADAWRIFRRGGIFLYPADGRENYHAGRLRLIYEAHPIAFLVEQAGGIATDGTQAILDITPKTLHQRTPLIFGSYAEVDFFTKSLLP